ncbi:hypothetical protein ISS07_02135 [Candidatus Woesearchaeota archaeon]|nr:hypothetical protein [Candidatus Woesearchaeota archaeon]
MPDKKLVNYIRQQIQKGYNTQELRTALVRYGYNPQDVDQALRKVYSPQVDHVIHFSPATWIGVSVVFITVIVSVFFFMNISKEPAQLLDLNLESLKTEIEAGNEISFISEIDNLGSADRYDVELKYELINLESNQVVTFKEETRAIETKGSKTIKIMVPETAAGNHMVRAIARYSGQRAIATLPVNIEAASKVAEETKEPIEEALEEIPEVVEEVPEEEEEERESSGDAALNTFEALEKVENVAKQNRLEAEKICLSLQLQTSKDLCFNKIAEQTGDRSYCIRIADERTKDVCLSNIAKQTTNSAICEQISKDSRKDSCYMNFVIDKKDYSVCNKVTNQYLRQSCDSLKQLSKLNISEVAFYESLLNQSFIEFV